MIDRYAVHALLEAGEATEKIAKQFGVSQRTIQRIAREDPVEVGDDAQGRRERGVGRPGVPKRVKERLRAHLAEDPEAPPLEYLRLLREEGVRMGESFGRWSLCSPAVSIGGSSNLQGDDTVSKLRVQSFGVSIGGYGAGPDQDLDHPLGSGAGRTRTGDTRGSVETPLTGSDVDFCAVGSTT